MRRRERTIQEVRDSIARLECTLGMCEHRLPDGRWSTPAAMAEHFRARRPVPPDPRPRSRR